ncbi:uncharacterized protein BDZ83DRAFT_633798 [Colletotrichum acutatum]|uniref:Uncharacterized protein n=1 Tax=Glomerella acutata TaxID=27357 RepID=A0AAD8XDN7_GLOAC|nr:uncharacterized protein BDZ83DRAFT_633798 [Colletotrichum acutatum]KAK1717451.1 hypothetical protein BDZ83DRAFT_633798 [Colletotrichum acutatum]
MTAKNHPRVLYGYNHSAPCHTLLHRSARLVSYTTAEAIRSRTSLLCGYIYCRNPRRLRVSHRDPSISLPHHAKSHPLRLCSGKLHQHTARFGGQSHTSTTNCHFMNYNPLVAARL